MKSWMNANAGATVKPSISSDAATSAISVLLILLKPDLLSLRTPSRVDALPAGDQSEQRPAGGCISDAHVLLINLGRCASSPQIRQVARTAAEGRHLVTVAARVHLRRRTRTPGRRRLKAATSQLPPVGGVVRRPRCRVVARCLRRPSGPTEGAPDRGKPRWESPIGSAQAGASTGIWERRPLRNGASSLSLRRLLPAPDCVSGRLSHDARRRRIVACCSPMGSGFVQADFAIAATPAHARGTSAPRWRRR